MCLKFLSNLISHKLELPFNFQTLSFCTTSSTRRSRTQRTIQWAIKSSTLPCSSSHNSYTSFETWQLLRTRKTRTTQESWVRIFFTTTFVSCPNLLWLHSTTKSTTQHFCTTQLSSLTSCLKCLMSTQEVEFWQLTRKRRERSRRPKRRRSRIRSKMETRSRNSLMKSTMTKRKTRMRRKKSRTSRDNSTLWERFLCSWTTRSSTSTFTSSVTRSSSRRTLSWSKHAPPSSKGSSIKRSNHGSSSKSRLSPLSPSSRRKTRRTTTLWEASTRK